MVIVIFYFNVVVWLSNWCSALRWTPWRCSWGRWWTWWMWSSLSRQQWHTMGWEMFKCDINQRLWHWCFCPKHKKPLMWERLKFDQRFHFLPENKVIWSHEGNMRYLLTTDLWIFLSDCSCDSGRLGRWSRACWKNWKRGGLVVRDWAGGFCEKSILTFFHDHYQLWSIKMINDHWSFITIVNALQTTAGVARAKSWADSGPDRLAPDDLFISADTDEVSQASSDKSKNQSTNI